MHLLTKIFLFPERLTKNYSKTYLASVCVLVVEQQVPSILKAVLKPNVISEQSFTFVV